MSLRGENARDWLPDMAVKRCVLFFQLAKRESQTSWGEESRRVPRRARTITCRTEYTYSVCMDRHPHHAAAASVDRSWLGETRQRSSALELSSTGVAEQLRARESGWTSCSHVWVRSSCCRLDGSCCAALRCAVLRWRSCRAILVGYRHTEAVGAAAGPAPGRTLAANM